MNFLVDAPLPRRLSFKLNSPGHDAKHTLDLPQGNRTPNGIINQLSIDEERVVVTKDVDFVDSLIVQRIPYKLESPAESRCTSICKQLRFGSVFSDPSREGCDIPAL